MQCILPASLYMFQQPSATVSCFWNVRFKQIQDATGKTKADVEATKPVHLQKSLLRSSISRCKDIFGNTKWGDEDAGEGARRWFYVHSFTHTQGTSLVQVLTGQTQTSGRNEFSQSLLGLPGCLSGRALCRCITVWQNSSYEMKGREAAQEEIVYSTLCTKKAGLKLQQPLGSVAFPEPIHAPRLGCDAPRSALWGLSGCQALLDHHLGKLRLKGKMNLAFVF